MKKCTMLILALLLTVLTAAAQQRYTVSGMVVDESDNPITGATVLQQGTANGTNTSADGKFVFAVDSGSDLIEIRYVGFETKIMTAAEVNMQGVIRLETSLQSVDEIVVIGYGTVRKGDMTGSVVAVKADELNRGATTSAQEMMMGRVAGLHITPGDGGPGSGSQIRIRGAASLYASNDPLIVIDGVPISNNTTDGMPNILSTINPDDIESFTVLKDASSTAIYGSRASNGVILITTKKGSRTGSVIPSVNYNGSAYISTNTETVDVMSADEFRNYLLERFPAGTTDGTNVRNLMGSSSTDWQDQIFRNAFGTDHTLSVSGNLPNNFMPYRVAFGYTNEDGTLKTSNMERATLDISLAPKFFDDHLSINLNAKGTYIDNAFADSGAVNGAAFFDPTQDLYFRNADGSIDRTVANGYWNWMTVTGAPNSLAGDNPLTTLYDNYNKSKIYRFTGNAQLDYKFHFLPELRANLNLGLDIAKTKHRTGTNEGSFNAMKDTDFPNLGRYSRNNYLNRNQLLEFYMQYNKEIDKHRFDVMAGYSWQHFFDDSRYNTYANSTNAVYSQTTDATEYYLLSFFGRANYSYDSRYLFTFTLRNDGTSRFRSGKRWGLFPSAAFAWNAKNEKFLQDVDVLSELKLRIGYGKTGQQDIGQGNYTYMARYGEQTSPGTNYPIDSEGGEFNYVSPIQPYSYNADLKWETTDTYNLGVDFGFLSNRINGSIDIYERRTKDLLNEIDVPMGSNFSNTVLSNIGTMKNRGLEFALNFTPVQTKDWNWTFGLTGTWQKTEITKLTTSSDSDYGILVGSPSAGTGGRIQMHRVGNAPYTFFAFQQVYLPNGKPAQNVFVDRDGDGVITDADRYLTGKSPEPDFYYGINSTVKYKDWDFSFSGHGSFGNWLYNDFYSSNSSPGTLTSGYLSNYARVIYKSGFTELNGSNQIFSDMFLENASFFRMDNITLGYTFRKLWNDSSRLRVAFNVQNVFVITNYSGMDPENSAGIDGNIWPRPRIYSIRLNLNF